VDCESSGLKPYFVWLGGSVILEECVASIVIISSLRMERIHAFDNAGNYLQGYTASTFSSLSKLHISPKQNLHLWLFCKDWKIYLSYPVGGA
jgi:hypothetical protein